MKIYELPEHQNIKLYYQNQIIIFDHIDGLDTKLNQTDINAIGMVISELDIANKKLDKIKEYIEKIWLTDKDSGEILIDLENILYDNMHKINKEEVK